MRKFIVPILALLLCCSLRAEDSIVAEIPMPVEDSLTISVAEPVHPNIIEDMKGVEIIQDSSVARLLNAAIYGVQELIEVDGFRVQVYSSNQQKVAKAEAFALEAELKENVTHTIYVTYQAPFWKVRLGDFRNYQEAREYKKEFLQLYPDKTGDTYIVKDKIKVLP